MGPASISQSTAPNIAIVGAGLAGLATALFLHRVRLTVTLYEARPQIASDGGYLALAPNAAHVLDQLGLYQKVLSQGFAYEEYTFLSARNSSKIGVILNGSTTRYGYPALRISRHILRQTLLDAVTEAGIPINFEHKMSNITETTSSVSIEFSSGQTSTCDYIIACDGIHSRVRRIIFPSAPEPLYSGQTGIGGGQIASTSIPSNPPQPCIFIGAGNSFMMMPTNASGSEVGVSATVEIPEHTREEWAELAADKPQIKKMLVDRHCDETSSWPETVRHACQATNAESLSIWPFYNAPALDSWTSKTARVVLIGDAAHAMPPTGGQGAAMAFEDAASLSLIFSKLRCSPPDQNANEKLNITADLIAWQIERQERVNRVKAFTSQSGDLRRATSGMAQQLVKEWLTWAFLFIKGREGGFAWIYEYRAEGPRTVAMEGKDQ